MSQCSPPPVLIGNLAKRTDLILTFVPDILPASSMLLYDGCILEKNSKWLLLFQSYLKYDIARAAPQRRCIAFEVIRRSLRFVYNIPFIHPEPRSNQQDIRLQMVTRILCFELMVERLIDMDLLNG